MSKLTESLEKLLDKTPHALLFEGPKGVGMVESARLFARKLLESEKTDHPDLREYYPEGKALLHPMHNIRALIHETETPPFEATCKVFLIHEADRMLPTSMNALLKTLEEPVTNCVMILITSHPQALLPTIISRCFSVPFAHPSHEEVEETVSRAMFNLGTALLHKEHPSLKEFGEIQNKEEALSCLFYFFRDLHLLNVGADPSHLFFQNKENELRSFLDFPLPDLEEVEAKIEKMRLGDELHIPISHSLCELF